MAGRWGEVRELGGAIIFLASDAASFVRELFDELPLGRRASPVEVADQIVFLASSRASHISGYQSTRSMGRVESDRTTDGSGPVALRTVIELKGLDSGAS